MLFDYCEISNFETISEIGDSTTRVSTFTKDGKYYWTIDDEYDGIEAEEIPKYLYDSLIKYGIEKEEKHKQKYQEFLKSKYSQ